MTLIRVGVKEKKIDVRVVETGGTGKSAYQVWLDAGNVGTVQDFFRSLVEIHAQIFQYQNQTSQIFTHNLGRAVLVQVIDDLGNTHFPDVQRISLNEVQIRTNIPKNLTIIIQ